MVTLEELSLVREQLQSLLAVVAALEAQFCAAIRQPARCGAAAY
jgi:hypothetical protein